MVQAFKEIAAHEGQVTAEALILGEVNEFMAEKGVVGADRGDGATECHSGGVKHGESDGFRESNQ
jgi:hypothetical protein